MPNIYRCSQCGAPLSPAQNRCPKCGTDIDWAHAVGRKSYIDKIGFSRKKRRILPWMTSIGVLLVIGMLMVGVWGMHVGRKQETQHGTLKAAPLSPARHETPTASSTTLPAATSFQEPPAPPPDTPTPAATAIPPLPKNIEGFRLRSGHYIASTVYDARTETYKIRFWRPASESFILPEVQFTTHPNFGPHSELAFQLATPDNAGIITIPANDQAQRITTQGEDSWPRWGPMGNQIIFTSTSRSADGRAHIYLVDTHSLIVEDLGRGQHADWASTGAIIYEGCDVRDENCGLWQLNPMTFERKQITDTPDDSFPTWSPEGRYICFMSSSRGQGWDVFMMDTQTGFIIPTATHPADDVLPIWSPDGRMIAFLSNREGDWAVYGWSLDDLTTVRLFSVSRTMTDWGKLGLDWH